MIGPRQPARPRGPGGGRISVAAAGLAIGIFLAGPLGLARGEWGTLHTGVGPGFRMKIDTRWPGGSGYRPARIEVVPTRPAIFDRTLTVEFVLDRYWGSRRSGRVVRQIEIPAGSTKVQTTLALPQTIAVHRYRLNVLEDGKLLPGLSFSWSPNANAGIWEETFPTVLVVAKAPPDTAELARLFSVAQYYQYQGGLAVNSPTPPLPTVAARDVPELPERWIDYSSCDLVFVSLDELDGLSRRRPRAFRALVEWTASGGNLCVSGIGRNWQGLGRLESLLGLPPGQGSGTAEPASRGWSVPDKRRFGKPPRGMGKTAEQSGQVYSPYYGYGVAVQEEPAVERKPPPSPPEKPHFVLREFQQGMVVALAADDPFPGTQWEWGWLLDTLGAKRVLWCQRHGLSVMRQNREFWMFLIPGVGLVPVNAFRVLITLFVLAIGPANYFLLRRSKRLHLLVITTPATALLVTGLLFGYALVADGLGMRVRVRSATHIDQARGHAVCWSRLSYYAGLAPARGLTFPRDVAVTPLEYVPAHSGARLRTLVWNGDQRLASGWLTSRTATQFVTVRSRPSAIGLGITEPADPAKGLGIENRLETRIEQLLVRSKAGDYYWAAGVAAGAQTTAPSVDPAVAFGRLDVAGRESAPGYPPGMDTQGPGAMPGLGINRYRWNWMYSQTGAAEPTQATGRLERAVGLLRSGNAGPAQLEPGSYLAVVERSPEVVLGTSAAREEAGFHLVQGTW